MNSLIVGTIAGILCTISFIPQVIKIIKTRNTRDISLITFSIFSMGVFFWFIYGIMIKSLPVIWTNAIIFVVALLIVIMKIRYK